MQARVLRQQINKPLILSKGTEIPYVESASSGATSVSFKKAVLSFEVTPQITPDNKVILDLVITQDSIGEVVPTGIGQAVSIDTQEIGTQVLVENGETLVLGGIYQQNVLQRVYRKYQCWVISLTLVIYLEPQ